MDYHIHFEPRPGGGQVVTVREIDARLEIDGQTPQDAQDAALRAITAHLEATHAHRRPRRRDSARARA